MDDRITLIHININDYESNSNIKKSGYLMNWSAINLMIFHPSILKPHMERSPWQEAMAHHQGWLVGRGIWRISEVSIVAISW